MEVYHQVMRDVLVKYNAILDLLLAGEGIDAISYSPVQETGRGTYDRNYCNRLRVLTALQFRFWQRPAAYSALLRLLFTEELKDRETNSFQGCGDALLLGAWMLKSLEDPKDCALFDRAKNANFDTFCGFDVNDLSPEFFPRELESTTLEDCLHILLSLKEAGPASRLIDLWISGQDTWNSAALSRLANLERDRGNPAGRANALSRLEAQADIREKPDRHCSVLCSLIESQLQAGLLPQAVQAAAKLRQRLASVPGWANTGLGRKAMEQLTDLLLAVPGEGAELWGWAAPVLKTMGHMHGNLLDKAGLAAEKMNDPALALQMRMKKEQLFLSPK